MQKARNRAMLFECKVMGTGKDARLMGQSQTFFIPQTEPRNVPTGQPESETS